MCKTEGVENTLVCIFLNSYVFVAVAAVWSSGRQEVAFLICWSLTIRCLSSSSEECGGGAGGEGPCGYSRLHSEL